MTRFALVRIVSKNKNKHVRWQFDLFVCRRCQFDPDFNKVLHDTFFGQQFRERSEGN